MRDPDRGPDMNRVQYFDRCERLLSLLATRVEVRGQLNILDLHSHCEDFYTKLLNLLFGYNLVNVNVADPNAEGVDLVDEIGKRVLQVSATATKEKVNGALAKDLSRYRGFAFNFLAISKSAGHLRGLSYRNPHDLVFDSNSDIYDIPAILRAIKALEITRQREISHFLSSELDLESPPPTIETNLAILVNIIAGLDLGGLDVAVHNVFDLDEKVAVNNLRAAAIVIEDYRALHAKIDGIYSQFDSFGKNRSKSVLDAFRQTYLRLSGSHAGDSLFFAIVDAMIAKVEASANYVAIPVEELELCINVLAVDAFIRCKIFKSPLEALNAPP